MNGVVRVAVFVALALAGCDAHAPVPRSATTYDIGWFQPGDIKEFSLSDGTRCVTNGNGITCEWLTSGPKNTVAKK